MIGRSTRVLAVVHAVEAVRAAHEELRAPVTGRAIRRVLAAEGIAIVPRAVRKSRAMVDDEGNAAIVLSTRRATHVQWKRLLHEYGHIKLHFVERGEIVRNTVACKAGDPREDDANLFAVLLVLGPDATPDHELARPIVAKIIGAEHRKRMPQQLPLELPEKLTMYAPLVEPFESERQYQRRIAKRGAKQFKKRVYDGPIAADIERIEFYDSDRGTTRFTDVAGRRWWVYNYRIAERDGGRRWELVRDFMSPSVGFRFFVNSLGRRQVYRFKDAREHRGYRVKHLDRQLAESVYVPDRLGPTFPTPRSPRRVTAEDL